MFVHVHK